MSTEIRFYHLKTQTPEQALPAILSKALEQGRRVVVRLPDAQAVERLDSKLWTYSTNAFIPHGSNDDGFAADQPVWLTDREENPNGADVLVLAGGAAADPGGYKLCCEMLEDGDQANLAAARARWKDYAAKGFSVTYWQQTDKGGWEQKAG